MNYFFALFLCPGFKLHYFSMLASLLIDLITNLRLMDTLAQTFNGPPLLSICSQLK